MIDPKRTAFLIIDMQNGFIDEGSPLCIVGAKATLPACAKALDHAREIEMPVFYVRRSYAEDGSNVEAVRYETWKAGGKPISEAMPGSADFPERIAPRPEDRIITKPRFSAFFGTGLDEQLRAMQINTLVLTGTTTPNCIRTTCYDGLSLGYNVVVIEDCTSSRTPEVQAANIEDMACIGAQLIDSKTFCSSGLDSIRDIEAEYLASLAKAR